MTRERTLRKLVLVQAKVGGREGWVHASWERSDGSKGSAFVQPGLAAAERWYIAQLFVRQPTNALLQDVPLARIASAINADPRIRQWAERGLGEETVELVHLETARRPKLKRPTQRRLDDAFYARVGAAYTGAVANGLPPAKTLADESDSPPGTVNRWVAAARKRGHLPPAQPGKVSA